MKKYILYSLMSIAIVSIISCQGNQKKAVRRAATPTVPTVKLPTRNITTYKSYPTNIEGVINIDVRAKISGYITDVLVDEGQKVSKGQLLFKLETHSLSEQADAAKANVNVAQVQVDQLKPLVKKNIVSKTKLATAKAKLKQAQSQYHSVVANIGYSDIRSPINGYVGKIRLRKGNLVSPSNAQPLTTITDIEKLYAYFSMNEKDYLNFLQSVEGKTKAEKINHLPKVTLIMANGQKYSHEGTIQTINSQIDKQTGTITFRAIFPNPKRILTNGSTGTIRVPHTYKNILVVPQQSTFEQQNKTLVLKVQKSGDSTRAIATVIGIEDKVRGLYLVQSGVEKGDEIVAQNVSTIPDGSLIKTNPVPFDSIAQPLPVIFFK